MTKEFNLSQWRTIYPIFLKQENRETSEVGYPEVYVKEFIKRLKEEIKSWVADDGEYYLGQQTFIKAINKLAGNDLK